MNTKRNKKNYRKIYFVRANNTKYGGAEIYLSRISNVLNKNNIDYDVINSIFPTFLPSWLRAILFNLQVSIFKGKRFYFSLERITCPDIYRAGDGVHKIFLSIEKKSKLNPLHPLYLFLEKRCFEKASKIIANSKMVKNNIISAYGIDSDKISVVYSGIELKEINYQYSFQKIAQEFQIKEGSPIILFVGSGFKRKGVKEFLQIIAALKNKEVIAFVVGKEKNLKDYKVLASELGIQSRVIFTGARLDVNDFYSISDIFLFPTHYEPFGNVILEAMHFKNVVFTTSQCGASELLSHEYIMQKPTDFSIINKIDKLLENTPSLKLTQENNRARSKQFSIEKNFEKTLKIIDEVIN